jgi:hypothetical protein
MKKSDLVVFALLCVGTTLLIGARAHNQSKKLQSVGDERYAGQYPGEQLNTANTQSFYSMLSQENQRKFDLLDPEHRTKAMEVLSKRGGASTQEANDAVDTQYNAQMKYRSPFGAEDIKDDGINGANPSIASSTVQTTVTK